MATVNEYLDSIMKQTAELREAYRRLGVLDTQALEGNTIIEVDRELDELLDILEEAEQRTARIEAATA